MAQDSGCCFRLAYRRLPQSRRRNLLAGELPQVAGHCSARRRTCSIASAAGASPVPSRQPGHGRPAGHATWGTAVVGELQVAAGLARQSAGVGEADFQLTCDTGAGVGG